MEDKVARRDDHERHHREREEARKQLQSHDQSVRHMQTRSQTQNISRQKDPKVRGELKQPGGGGRGKY